MVEEVLLAHMPPELKLYIAHFTDLQNAHFLREQLLAGNTDFDYALIDASTVVSRNHVLAACFRALNDYLHERIKSRNVHSEIVFSLSPNNNIGEAFRRFGISDSTKNLIVVKVAVNPDMTKEKIQEHLTSSLKAQEAKFDDEALARSSDIPRIRKIYKLLAPAADKVSNGIHSSQPEHDQLETQVLGAMALRGAT